MRLINAARGGIYDEAALVEGLKSGKLGGVALDVFADEPCTNSPLFGMPGVVCTPHLGASTEEAQTQVAIEAVELLTAYLTTGAIRHAVNVASLDPKTLASLRGYLDVAYRLGLLLAGLQPGGLKKCRLLYRGEIADKETKVLTAVFAAGLLENALDEEVNLVNAELLLKQRGIELIEESRSDMGAFRSSMTAEVITDQARRTGRRARSSARTCRGWCRSTTTASKPISTAACWCSRHHDVPGIIGSVGTVFGQHRREHCPNGGRPGQPRAARPSAF